MIDNQQVNICFCERSVHVHGSMSLPLKPTTPNLLLNYIRKFRLNFEFAFVVGVSLWGCVLVCPCDDLCYLLWGCLLNFLLLRYRPAVVQRMHCRVPKLLQLLRIVELLFYSSGLHEGSGFCFYL